MLIKIKATNLELTPALKAYVQDKISMLDKYLGRQKVITAEVELELTTKHHLKGEIFRAEMNLQLPGELLRVTKTEKNLYKAVDKVKDHLAEMIIKSKDKKADRRRQIS